MFYTGGVAGNRHCRKCGAPAPPDASFCRNPACEGWDPNDLVYGPVGLPDAVEFKCPHCGGEVLYVGVVPAALECGTPGCKNFRRDDSCDDS